MITHPTAGDDVVKALQWLASPQALPILQDISTLAAFVPALRLFSGITPAEIQEVAKLASGNLIAGLLVGSIVRDSGGGFIPAHGQSIFNQQTGAFTGQKT